jgi:WD40 repeat protein
LNRELGVEPSLETQAIYEQLKKGEKPELILTPPFVEERAVTDAPPTPGDPPFKGLQFFDQADADIFFGRESLTANLVKHLREGHSFLVVVGASGSGKSSIVRAGLVPALRRGEPLADGEPPPKGSEDWLIHVITPTAHPLEALATSLTSNQGAVNATTSLVDDMARDPYSLHLAARRLIEDRGVPRLLLVVDQFEELFTLCREETERKAFIDNLLTAVAGETGEPTTIVLTLRADFYTHCSTYPKLRRVLTKQQEYIGPMTAREMRRAIEEPAKHGGWDFQPGMVDLFLRDVKGEPGALPLLSHALLETWQRRSGRTLTLKGYAASGGVPRAIARTADTVFNRHLTVEQQAIARNIFLRLTELGEGTQDTRRRVALSELIPRPDEAAAVGEVIKKLADARLITTYEDTVEVAHEALIREWPTLREWLDEDREGLQLHRHLTESAQEWHELDRDPGELYRGARLARTVEWASEHERQLNEPERKFLEASQILAAEEEAEREAQRQREIEAARKLAEAERKRAAEQIKSVRRLRRLAIGLGGVLLIAVVAAGIALQQRRQAVKEAHLRAARELATFSMDNLGGDPELSILLLLEAVREVDSVGIPIPLEVEDALHQAVQQWPLLLEIESGNGGVYSVAFNPGGSRIATAGQDGNVRVWDATSGEELLVAVGHTERVTGVCYSPDGRRIATSSHDHTAKIWDSETGQMLLTISGHLDEIEDIVFNPDGSHLATASRDGTAKVWLSATGEELFTYYGHSDGVAGIAYSPDGTHVVTAGFDNTVKIWNESTGVELLTVHSEQDGLTKVAISPEGTRLVTVGPDASIWDAETGILIELKLHSSPALNVAFNPDGTRIVTTSSEGRMVIWDVMTGNELLAMRHPGRVFGVAFSPDGTRLATSSEDGTVRVWDVSLCREFLNIITPGRVGRVVYSPDGSRLAAGVGEVGMVMIWDSYTGSEILTLDEGGHVARVENVAFSPDGSRLATSSGMDNSVKIWDIASGQCLHTLTGHRGGDLDVAYSPDGNRLVTSSYKQVKIWDAATREELMSIDTNHSGITAVAFSPDGSNLVTASQSGIVKLWDSSSGDELLSLNGKLEEIVDIVYSTDGTRLATVNNADPARIWDPETGEVVITLYDHQAYDTTIAGVALSPDMSRVVTAYLCPDVRVWSTATGHQLYRLYDCCPSCGHITGITFSPDGKQLATSSEDGIRIYLFDIEDLVALAKSRLTRDFTREECLQYFRAERCTD